MKTPDKYRIISMDGSSMTGGNGYVTAGILQGIQSALKTATGTHDLLKDVFLYAGTSAGAFNAFFLAQYDDPDCALPHILDFWQLVMNANGPAASASILRTVRALTGQSAFLSTAKLREFFTDYFGNTRLGDLKQKVLVGSFQLDNGKSAARSWKPKVFNNFDNDPDCDLKVADVAMRSGSPPLITPIYQGYVDGGVVANDPTMLAIAQVLREVQADCGDLNPLHHMLVLSIGNAKVPHYLAPTLVDGIADWGYGEWVFDLSDPLVLLTMLMDSSVLTINYEVERLLGLERYFRINPLLAKPLDVTNGSDVLPAVAKFMADPVTQTELKAAVRWLESSGWVKPLAPPPPAPPAEAPAQPVEHEAGDPAAAHHEKRKKH